MGFAVLEEPDDVRADEIFRDKADLDASAH